MDYVCNILEVADKFCPFKSFSITKRKTAYLTNEILELIKERDTVLRLARIHNSDEYWLRGQSLIKELVKAVSSSKKEFIMNKLIANQKDSSKFWKSVKLVLPDKNPQNLNVVWDAEKKELVSGVLAANLINKYFCGIGGKLSNELEQSDMVLNLTQSDCTFEWENGITI